MCLGVDVCLEGPEQLDSAPPHPTPPSLILILGQAGLSEYVLILVMAEREYMQMCKDFEFQAQNGALSFLLPSAG